MLVNVDKLCAGSDAPSAHDMNAAAAAGVVDMLQQCQLFSRGIAATTGVVGSPRHSPPKPTGSAVADVGCRANTLPTCIDRE